MRKKVFFKACVTGEPEYSSECLLCMNQIIVK